MTQPTAHIDAPFHAETPEVGAKITQLDPQGANATVTRPALPRVRADALSRALGSAEFDTLREHHLTLAMAVIEIAADAGAPLPWSHDDPTIALLRAAAKLAITAPDATSSAAADLVNQLSTAASSNT